MNADELLAMIERYRLTIEYRDGMPPSTQRWLVRRGSRHIATGHMLMDALYAAAGTEGPWWEGE